jgi:hypothetical protein
MKRFLIAAVSAACLLTLAPASSALATPAHMTTKAHARAESWDAVLGQRLTMQGADALKAEAEAKGIHSRVERHGRHDFRVVVVEGSKTRHTARIECARIRTMGLHCRTERS